MNLQNKALHVVHSNFRSHRAKVVDQGAHSISFEATAFDQLLNVSGSTNLNNVSIKGNLNVLGTTTIIDTVINNTSFNSLSVSGPSIYYSNITLVSSLNVLGNIIGSGTSLTNLNYNAIPNKPDLSGYALTTNLNNISTSAI